MNIKGNLSMILTAIGFIPLGLTYDMGIYKSEYSFYLILTCIPIWITALFFAYREERRKNDEKKSD